MQMMYSFHIQLPEHSQMWRTLTIKFIHQYALMAHARTQAPRTCTILVIFATLSNLTPPVVASVRWMAKTQLSVANSQSMRNWEVYKAGCSGSTFSVSIGLWTLSLHLAKWCWLESLLHGIGPKTNLKYHVARHCWRRSLTPPYITWEQLLSGLFW